MPLNLTLQKQIKITLRSPVVSRSKKINFLDAICKNRKSESEKYSIKLCCQKN